MSMRLPQTPTRRKVLSYALAAALLAVAAAVACTQTGTPQPGGVSGTFDLARVGQLVFVTSADRAELRVLNARRDGGANDGAPRDWVRAPNPLEALQIPVVDRPVGLTRDLTWSAVEVDELTPLGGEVTGPYVYAFSGGRSEISVVGADPSQLRELKRLAAGGPVTAASALGPAAGVPDSTLFYATLVDGTGSLYSVRLDPPAQIGSQTPAPQLLMRMDAGESIAALQVLPRHQEVAVAVRSARQPAGGGAAVVTGRAFALSPSTGAARDLLFGAPVRILATHPGTSDGTFLPEENLFGVVDEESCGGAGTLGCARVLAVDVQSGQPALDFSGQPALPVMFERGLPQSLTFAANAGVRTITARDGGVASVPVMGLLTSTDGNIYFFEAVGRPRLGTEPEGELPVPQWTIRHVNETALPGVGINFFFESPDAGADGGNGALPYFPLQPARYPAVEEDGGVILAPYYGLVQLSVVPGLGTARAEPVVVTFEGVIPELRGLPTTDADGQSFPLPAASGAVVGRVAVGDRIVVSREDGAECADLTVTSVSSTALGTTDTIPPGCAARASFSVRAADPLPYVVMGLASGYMGRAGDGTQVPGQPVAPARFQFVGTPYYRADPAVHDPVTFPPTLTFDLALRPPELRRDFRYTFQTSTGFEPLFFLLSSEATAWPGYHLPYGVVVMPDAPRVYVSYPSVARSSLLGSGAVIEMDPRLMLPSQPNVQINSSYR